MEGSILHRSHKRKRIDTNKAEGFGAINTDSDYFRMVHPIYGVIHFSKSNMFECMRCGMAGLVKGHVISLGEQRLMKQLIRIHNIDHLVFNIFRDNIRTWTWEDVPNNMFEYIEGLEEFQTSCKDFIYHFERREAYDQLCRACNYITVGRKPIITDKVFFSRYGKLNKK